VAGDLPGQPTVVFAPSQIDEWVVSSFLIAVGGVARLYSEVCVPPVRPSDGKRYKPIDLANERLRERLVTEFHGRARAG